jgi:hypothetical protein
MPLGFRIATGADFPLILSFIRESAEYERLAREVSTTEDLLRASLFGERQGAEVVIGRGGDEPAGCALFFHDFSTFFGRPSIEARRKDSGGDKYLATAYRVRSGRRKDQGRPRPLPLNDAAPYLRLAAAS